ACPNANEHLDEIGARNGEERHIGFARHRARDESLAGTGRPDQKDAARNAAAKALELARVTKEFNDLLEILLCLIDACYVFKRDPAMSFSQQLRSRISEPERLATCSLP